MSFLNWIGVLNALLGIVNAYFASETKNWHSFLGWLSMAMLSVPIILAS